MTGFQFAHPVVLAPLRLTGRYLCLLYLVCTAAVAAPATNDEVVLVADEWCPYNCAAQADRPGIALEIAQRAFGAQGLRVRYLTLDWGDALTQVRLGAADAALGVLRPEAPDLLFPEHPFAFSSNCLFGLGGSNWSYTGTESLHGLRIGAAAGYSYGANLDATLDDPGFKERVFRFGGEVPVIMLAAALQRGFVDVILADDQVLTFYLSAKPGARPIKKIHCQPSTGVYFGFSPTHPERARHLIELLDTTIDELLRSGAMRSISQHYE